MDYSDIVHDAEKMQFSMQADSATATVNYTIRNGKFYLDYSEVPYPLRGKGIGKVVVEKTFEWLENEGIEAIAVCSFIKKVARENSKWNGFLG